jgi:mono/diheme cytochrome c family protein
MKKKIWIFIGLVAFAAVGATGYFHATRNKRHHEKGTPAAQVYSMYCARCHGETGEPISTNFDLRQSTLGLDDFVNIVKGGRNSMPAFTKTFTDDEFEPLYRHIQNLKL